MYPTSFFCLLHFIFFSVFVLTSPRKINYLSIIYGHLQAVLRGCFAKVFYPPHYNWKVTSRLSGYFTKILQKFFRYNWFFADGNISVFSKNLKHPPYILDICIPVCWGVSLNFFQKASYYNWKLQREKLMVYTNFSRRKISSHYKWTFEYRLAGCFRKK